MTCHRRPEPFIIKEKNDREEKKSTKKKVLREDVGGDCSQLREVCRSGGIGRRKQRS